MMTRTALLLSLVFVVTGCKTVVLPGSNRIWEERTASPTTEHRSLVMREPLYWFASEKGDRYEIWLPQGAYQLESQDSDYWYYQAPERVTLGKTKFFESQDTRTYSGGIFVSNKTNPAAHAAGAYVDYEGGRKLLLFVFDFRFTLIWQNLEYPEKPEAGIEGDAIWIWCIPEELATHHLQHLEQTVAEANEHFRAHLQRQEACLAEQVALDARFRARLDALGLKRADDPKRDPTPALRSSIVRQLYATLRRLFLRR